MAALDPANTSADCTVIPCDAVQADMFPDSNPSSNAFEEGGVVTLRMLLSGDSFPAASLARTR